MNKFHALLERLVARTKVKTENNGVRIIDYWHTKKCVTVVSQRKEDDLWFNNPTYEVYATEILEQQIIES